MWMWKMTASFKQGNAGLYLQTQNLSSSGSSMMAGAVLGGADEQELALVESAASDIGLAFQIRDDILDVTSTSEELGKPVHSDEKNNKITYVTLFGTEEASRQVEALSESAVSSLEKLNRKNEFLTALVREMAGRRK